MRVAIGMILLRLVLFFVNADFSLQEEMYVFLNLAAVPVIVLYAIWPRKHLVGAGFMEDFILSLRIAALYGVIMSVFGYFYYTQVDLDFFANKQEEIIELRLTDANAPDRATVTDEVTSFFSVRNFALIALLIYIFLSIFYAILFSALKRLIIRVKSA